MNEKPSVIVTYEDKSESDEVLMAKAKAGDLDGIAILFDRYHLALYNFFLYQVKDQNKSEDLTQNVFEKIIVHRDKYKEDRPFKGWLYKIAWNEHHDSYRGKKLVLPGDDSFRSLTSDIMETKVDQYEDEKMRLKVAMGQLTSDQQQLIQMTRFEGLRYAEIADIMGCTVSNLKVKVHRTMKNLKNHYFQLGEI